MKSINPIEDLRKYLNVLPKSESSLKRARIDFHSGIKIKWLEEYSQKTFWSYKVWHDTCKILLEYCIIPNLKTLNDLNSYCCQYNIRPIDLLARLRYESAILGI